MNELVQHIFPDKVHLYDPTDITSSKKRLKSERDLLKRVRLGLGYGMQVNTLSKYIEVNKREAQRIYKAYTRRYSII